MSWHDCSEAEARFTAAEIDPIRTIVVPRTSDIGNFEVRRALPSRAVRMVGPFVFFDQMGPGELLTDQGLDVRPHPHIGLATVTYLFSGRVMHKDSLGTAVAIEPGAVNLMTAGRGIAHSERTPEADRRAPSRLYGIQAWVALPKDQEERAPDFSHHAAAELPVIEAPGVRVRLIAGELFGERSPVPMAHETVYADVGMEAGARLPLDAGHEERALYLVEGAVEIAGVTHAPGRLLVLRPGDALTVRAVEPARLLLLGGAPMTGRGTSGGTSSRRAGSGSRPPRPTGRPAGSRRCRARSSISRCLHAD
jgi:redox-sensitive bicupin YhaK (pirin superfamily)